jgi:hypothetical protein
MKQQGCAFDELLEELKPGEVIESVVFNTPCMYDFYGPNGEDYIPAKLIGQLIPFEEAKQYFFGWNISGGFGNPDVVPFYVWTNYRVLFIGCYDGATWLESVPRNPTNVIPNIVGGG